MGFFFCEYLKFRVKYIISNGTTLGRGSPVKEHRRNTPVFHEILSSPNTEWESGVVLSDRW